MGQIWLVVHVLAPGSGFLLGLTTALQSAPMVLAFWGGAVADAYDRRRVLVATQAAAGLLAAGLGVVVLAGAASLPVVWACALALGAVNAVDVPARQAFVAELVAADDLTSEDRVARGSYVGCVAGALSFEEYRRGLQDVGFTDITIDPTHEEADRMYGAIVKARKP
jgi:MFS family permease